MTTDLLRKLTFTGLAALFLFCQSFIARAQDPDITVTPDSLSVTLDYGQSQPETLSIGNTGTADLNWAFGVGTAGKDLGNVLSRLNENYETITDLIPGAAFLYELSLSCNPSDSAMTISVLESLAILSAKSL